MAPGTGAAGSASDVDDPAVPVHVDHAGAVSRDVDVPCRVMRSVDGASDTVQVRLGHRRAGSCHEQCSSPRLAAATDNDPGTPVTDLSNTA
jgi:hypothetical protein